MRRFHIGDTVEVSDGEDFTVGEMPTGVVVGQDDTGVVVRLDESKSVETCDPMNVFGLEDSMMPSVLDRIKAERGAQLIKWGVQRHDPGTWMLILMEEIGELSMAILQNQGKEKILAESVQCAAVMVAWIEELVWRGYAD